MTRYKFTRADYFIAVGGGLFGVAMAVGIVLTIMAGK
jgi:hypothetical protein